MGITFLVGGAGFIAAIWSLVRRSVRWCVVTLAEELVVVTSYSERRTL